MADTNQVYFQEYEFVSVKEEPWDEEELKQVSENFLVDYNPWENSKALENGQSQEFEFVSVKEEPQDEEEIVPQELEFEPIKEEPWNEKELPHEHNVGKEIPSSTLWLQNKSIDASSTPVDESLETEELQYESLETEEQQYEVMSEAPMYQECRSYSYTNRTPVCKFWSKLSQLGEFTCNSCLVVFPSKYSITVHVFSHIEEVQPPPHICECCGDVFSTAGELNQHLSASYHSVLSASAMLQARGSLAEQFPHQRCETSQKTHKHSRRKEKTFSCKICRKLFVSARNLQSHKRSHAGEYMFRCATCWKGFNNFGKLIEHNREHNTGKSHSYRRSDKS